MSSGLEERIREEMALARVLAEETGRDIRSFQKIALEKCGLTEYAQALDPLPAIIQGDVSGEWLTPTQIGKVCGGLTPREVNGWLYTHDFQYPEGNLWRLTTKGENHGEEYYHTLTNKHSEIRIRWNRSVLTASGLKRSAPASCSSDPVGVT